MKYLATLVYSGFRNSASRSSFDAYTRRNLFESQFDTKNNEPNALINIKGPRSSINLELRDWGNRRGGACFVVLYMTWGAFLSERPYITNFPNFKSIHSTNNEQTQRDPVAHPIESCSTGGTGGMGPVLLGGMITTSSLRE
jgi:hypothetical protein